MTPVQGCAIATRRYLAHARVLVRSFLEHHPEGRFSLLMVDSDEGGVIDDERFELLTPADMGVDERELHRRGTMYLAQGWADSFKPDLLCFLLARDGAPIVLLDADSCIYADLVPVVELASEHSLVLSPHNLDPLPLHGSNRHEERWRDDSPEQITMRAGLMNAGLIAVAPGAEHFLQWWSERTHLRCVFDEPHALMLCQTWLTLATVLFDHRLLRDRGCNVAGWNLHGRDVRWRGDTPEIDGGPLRHFHFAGSFDPDLPEQITPIESLASWWASLRERPGAARVARQYAQALIDYGYRQVHAAPRPYDQAPDGRPIEPWMRASYRAAVIDAERDSSPEPPNPFSDGPNAFFDWLRGRTASELENHGRHAGGGDTLSRRELTTALLDGDKMLTRIEELEAMRDEAIVWAKRTSDELEITSAERDRQSEELSVLLARIQELHSELAAQKTMMDSIWSSPSWRLTKPLRAAKGLMTRATGGARD
jgi:hypothetical protein